jgi:D-glycero-alpha-D-manno-heptose-7-phosphate kinase
MSKIIRSRAPLRIGLAGGGTDVSPYSDLYGGAILNVTIGLYATTTIIPTANNKVHIRAVDRNEEAIYDATAQLPIDGHLDLAKGVYNRVIKQFNNNQPLSCEIITHVEAPAGSGLGTSSTLMVSILGAFTEWLNLPLGEYDIAHLAYEIERLDLGLSGGKQDQYAATFGGFNFMEFYANDKVIVNPLRIKPTTIHELEYNTVLYYTDTSRESAKIIDDQTKNVNSKDSKSIEATHKVKEQAYMMKEALLKGDLNQIGEILDYGWQHKKQMAKSISNPLIDTIYDAVIKAGATGGKISGAGGGGFMTIYCPGTSRYQVEKTLLQFGGVVRKFHFTNEGLTTWSV